MAYGTGGSALLRCLEQLNDDVWAEVLLPKLLADQTAGAAAASCSTLRRLCHGTVKKLNLTALGSSCSDGVTVQHHLEALHQHFPSCSAVKMAVHLETSYLMAPAMLERLSRLSCLCDLELTVEGMLNSLALGMVLSSINAQLPQLRTLSLTSKCSWTGADAVWSQLGQATQLTKLGIKFDKAIELGAHMKDLAPLSSLTGLQCLAFRLGKMAAKAQGLDCSDARFFGNLTALNTLAGDIVLKAGMVEHISSCTALQSLVLHTRTRVRPSSSDWQALGQLVQLTKLHISPGMMPPDQDMQQYYSALQCLTDLQQLVAWRITAGVVPTLAALTKLTAVHGSWVAGGQAWDGDVACEHVVRMIEASGLVPFKAFPNVEVVGLAGPLDVASWEALGSWCPKVRKIATSTPRPPMVRPAWPCFPSGAAGTERVATLKGLAQLTHLTQLQFNVSHELEVLALADAVKQVELLKFGVCPVAGLDWGCLLPLAKLPSVKSAYLCMCVPPPSKHVVQMLLSGLAHARSVTLFVTDADVAAVQEAFDESRAMGLSSN